MSPLPRAALLASVGVFSGVAGHVGVVVFLGFPWDTLSHAVLLAITLCFMVAGQLGFAAYLDGRSA
jgi:hypothetical protein